MWKLETVTMSSRNRSNTHTWLHKLLYLRKSGDRGMMYCIQSTPSKSPCIMHSATAQHSLVLTLGCTWTTRLSAGVKNICLWASHCQNRPEGGRPGFVYGACNPGKLYSLLWIPAFGHHDVVNIRKLSQPLLQPHHITLDLRADGSYYSCARHNPTIFSLNVFYLVLSREKKKLNVQQPS